MAKPRKNISKKKKKTAFGRPVLTLFIIFFFIVSLFTILEKLKDRATPPVTEKPVVTEEHKMPALPPKKPAAAERIEHQPYTSVAPIPPVHPKKGAVGPGSVAIIIDDMGSSVQEADELMAINLPLTFSIIPGLSHVKGVETAIRARGYQSMIHIPMEPKGYPQQRLEKYGLLLSQSDDEIRRRLESFLRENPGAKGSNNHMGSRFTEDRAKMETVLRFLKAKGLFFIDSRTSPDSVGSSLAREMGVETASRNVFLDNTQDVAAIKAQLEQLASFARRKGAAIGICHPHRATIQALAETMPELKRSGINFVFAADLVR